MQGAVTWESLITESCGGPSMTLGQHCADLGFGCKVDTSATNRNDVMKWLVHDAGAVLQQLYVTR